jgi:hypothetical protein
MVPDHTTVALLLLDIVNDLGFPVPYMNDNYVRWQSDFRYAAGKGSAWQADRRLPGAAENDYFVLKAKRSALLRGPSTCCGSASPRANGPCGQHLSVLHRICGTTASSSRQNAWPRRPGTRISGRWVMHTLLRWSPSIRLRLDRQAKGDPPHRSFREYHYRQPAGPVDRRSSGFVQHSWRPAATEHAVGRCCGERLHGTRLGSTGRGGEGPRDSDKV